MLARQAAPGPMTFEEYLEWEADQDEKWELVDGYPVRWSDRKDFDPATGMAGTTQAHGRLVANLIVALRSRLRGGPCTPLPSQIKLEAARGNARYPDVSVDCGTAANESLTIAEPRVLFEVLSRSNTFARQLRLLEDYQATAAVAQIVWLEQRWQSAILWTRTGDGWSREMVEGPDAVLELASIGVNLPLSEVYEGLDLGDEPPRGAQRRPQ